MRKQRMMVSWIGELNVEYEIVISFSIELNISTTVCWVCKADSEFHVPPFDLK